MTSYHLLEEEQKPLPNGWRLSEPYSESKEAAYVKQMVTELSAIPRMKIPPTTTQPPSTQELLDAQKLRPEWQDEAYIREKFAKDFPDHAQVRDDYGNINVNERNVTAREAVIFTENRRKARNTTGQSAESSVTPEKRQQGIEAFTYSKPANVADIDLARLTKLNQTDAIVASEPAKPEEKPAKLGLIERFAYWFRYKGDW